MTDPQTPNPDAAPRKRGRPRLDPAAAATVKFTLRLPPELAAAMSARGIGAPQIRQLIVDAIGAIPASEPTP